MKFPFPRTCITEPLEIADDTTLWPVTGDGSFPVAETASHCGRDMHFNSDDSEVLAAIRIRDCWNACHGLDLPASVPVGILADAVHALKMARVIMRRFKELQDSGDIGGKEWTEYGMNCEAIESANRALDKLNPAPVSPQKARLEYLRSQIDAECISYGELAELESLKEFIEPGDVQLLEWAGVPEFPEDENPAPVSTEPQGIHFTSCGYTVIKTPDGAQRSFRGTKREELEEQARDCRERIARETRFMETLQAYLDGKTVQDPEALR